MTTSMLPERNREESAFAADHPIPGKEHIVVIRTPYGKPQAVPVAGTIEPGFSAIYRNVRSQDRFIASPHPAVRTVYDVFEHSASVFADGDCLGHRYYSPQYKTWGPYVWQSYAQVADRRTHFGSGLLKVAHDVAGVQAADKFPVAIFSPNRAEWVITDLACQAYNLYNVALYDSLGPEASEHILNLTETPVLVASLSNIPAILTIKHKLPHLKVIISMDDLDNDNDNIAATSKRSLLKPWADAHAVTLFSFAQIEQLGRDAVVPHTPPSPQDVLTINFTSGTTGLPKGVVLTHRNALAAVTASMFALAARPRGTDVVISYLPLAHIYERVAMCEALAYGAAYGFLHGSVLELVDDIKQLRPTLFPSVPRLLSRMEEVMRAKTVNAPSKFAAALSRRALQAKLDDMRAGGTGNLALWDALWSRKIRKNAGFDRLVTAVSGSAPISDSTLQFLRAALACSVIQGYGLTESFANGLIGEPDDKTPGHSGPPVICNEVRLKDVPEMNYFSTDRPNPRGELLMRGPLIFREYYKDPQRTAETIDSEGWLHTGDVASIDSLGRVSIIDRVKNFFKLAQGEYVAPERIENIYAAGTDIVSQIFVHGDSVQTFLVAIVAVNPDTFAAFAGTVLGRPVNPADSHDIAAAAADTRVRQAAVRELDRVAKQARLQGFERVRNISLKLDPFTAENGLITPTMKLKRAQVVTYFRSDIDSLYQEGSLLRQPQAAKSKL
ncbi:eukaryotic long-chain fatty acid CoA synthetase (LC-FACS) [Lipomyces japonicus]|uniref:eukaryotic long-chain fatty acid CoA synthetase (LC-FACS) n=1 Tax=Lipomyces japonicus TaxID=56871 RepID=UPI0034CEADE5